MNKLYIILFLFILIIILLFKKKENLTTFEAINNINKINQESLDTGNFNIINFSKGLKSKDKFILDPSGNLDIKGNLNLNFLDIDISGKFIIDSENFKLFTNNDNIDVNGTLNLRRQTYLNDTNINYYLDGVTLISTNILDPTIKSSNPTRKISFGIGTWLLAGYDFDKQAEYVILNPGFGVILYANIFNDDNGSVKIKNFGLNPVRLKLKLQGSNSEDLVTIDKDFTQINGKDINGNNLPSISNFFNTDINTVDIMIYSENNQTKYLSKNVSSLYVFDVGSDERFPEHKMNIY